MAVVAENRRVFGRLGAAPSTTQSRKICYHWQAGRCNRFRCPFLHAEMPQSSKNNGTVSTTTTSQALAHGKPKPNLKEKPIPDLKFSNRQQLPSKSKWVRDDGADKAPPPPPPSQNKVQDKCCHYWMKGNCTYGDSCRYQHKWFVSDSFSFLTQLHGHEKGIYGIVLPLGFDKLFSGSKDGTVRIWDCNTGQCANVVNLGSEIGCMITEGPWVFVGASNVVKAWNCQTNTDLNLNGPVGQVYSLEASINSDMLFAGTQDGNILVWRYNAATNSFDPAAILKGHNLPVVSLVVGSNRLYSGSMDHTVRVWDLENLLCVHVLTEHKDVVMSVLCWDQYLLSSSLDGTIKVWGATESGSLEVVYTHIEKHGVLALNGMTDADAKPVLMCSCNDNIVRFYELPSFKERGRIFSKQEIRVIRNGVGGLFFTGDGAGELKVWKLAQ